MGMPKSFIRKVGRFWRGLKSRPNKSRRDARLNLWRLVTKPIRLRRWLGGGHYVMGKKFRQQLSQARRLTYNFNATGNVQPCSKTHRRSLRTRSHGQLVLVLALVSLTAAMSYPFLSQPLYDVDSRAPQNIQAPFDATVSDLRGTEERRKDAINGVVPVLSEDPVVTEQIMQDLRRSLNRGDEIRQISEPFPIVPVDALSEESQVLLRNLPTKLWRSLRSQLQQGVFKASWWVQEVGPCGS
ncbi:MAG: hypothetical protein AAF889_13395 [Cyanobacteria bacterium P01_D01_bin.73]